MNHHPAAARILRAGLLLTLVATLTVAACGGESDTVCMPPSGGLKGGYEVRINGEGFEHGSMVLFGGKPVKDVKFVGEGAIAVKAPAADEPGPVDIVVTSPKGTRTMYEKAFTYTAMAGLDIESTARPAPAGGTGASGGTSVPVKSDTGGAEYAPSGGGSGSGSASAAPASASAAPGSASGEPSTGK